MNKIRYMEFDNEGKLIRIIGTCKAKDFKKILKEKIR